MGIDTTFNLKIRHKNKRQLVGAQIYFRTMAKARKWGSYELEEIIKVDGVYLLSIQITIYTDPPSTGVTGEGGELGRLLEKIPDLQIEGTFEYDYGHGTVSGYELGEETSFSDDDNENDERGAAETNQEGEEDQNEKPLSPRQVLKKEIKGYRFT